MIAAGFVAVLSTVDGVRTLAEAVAGPLDVLVNNAGAHVGRTAGGVPGGPLGQRRGHEPARGVLPVDRAVGRLRAAATPDDSARVINTRSAHGLRVSEWDNRERARAAAGVPGPTTSWVPLGSWHPARGVYLTGTVIPVDGGLAA